MYALFGLIAVLTFGLVSYSTGLLEQGLDALFALLSK